MQAAADIGGALVVSSLEGRAVVHKAFGGSGVADRRTCRQNAHDALMRCTDDAGNPSPKCFHATADQAFATHSVDCDHATGLLEQLRALVK